MPAPPAARPHGSTIPVVLAGIVLLVFVGIGIVSVATLARPGAKVSPFPSASEIARTPSQSPRTSPRPSPSASPSSDPLAAEINDEVKALPTGTLSWNPPKRLPLGARAIVTARIALIPPSQQPPLEGPGQPNHQPIQVSHEMELLLKSDNPEGITVTNVEPPTTDQWQATFQYQGHDFAEWKWQLAAVQTGTWPMRLAVYLRLKSDQEEQIREVPWSTTVDATRNLEVVFDVGTSPQFLLASYWQWIVGTVIALLALIGGPVGVIVKRRQEAKRKEEELKRLRQVFGPPTGPTGVKADAEIQKPIDGA